MNTRAEKIKENKKQPVSASSFQIQSGGEPTFQFEDNRPETIAQRKLQEMVNNSPQAKQAAQLQAMADNHSSKQQKPIQKKENNTGLPDNLKSGIENLSGYSMDDVNVHYNSDKPAQLQAHAYAQGFNIYLGPGQEKHLAHEAWHTVQQKQGRVQPTAQLKEKININDDAGLEQEADTMGAKALSLGQTNSSSSALVQKKPLQPIQPTSTQAVQRKVGFEIETNIPVHKEVQASDKTTMEHHTPGAALPANDSHIEVTLRARFTVLNLTAPERAFIQHYWPTIMRTLHVDPSHLDKAYKASDNEDVINNPNKAITDVEDKLKDKFFGKAFQQEFWQHYGAHVGTGSALRMNKFEIVKGLALMAVSKLKMVSKYGLQYDREEQTGIDRSGTNAFTDQNLLLNIDSSRASDTAAKMGAPVIGNAILEIVSKPIETDAERDTFIAAITALMGHIKTQTNQWRQQGKITNKIWTGPVHNLPASGFNVDTQTTGTFQINFGTTLTKYRRRMHALQTDYGPQAGIANRVPANPAIPQMGYMLPEDHTNLQNAFALEARLEASAGFRKLHSSAKQFFRVVMIDLAVRCAGPNAKGAKKDGTEGWDKNASPLLIKANFDQLYSLIDLSGRPPQNVGYEVLDEIETLIKGDAGTTDLNKTIVTESINHIKNKLNWFTKIEPSADQTSPAGRPLPVSDGLFVAETRFHQRTHEPYAQWATLIRDVMRTYLDGA